MKGYLVTNNETLWELRHSQYAKSEQSKYLFEGLGKMIIFLLVFGTVSFVDLKGRDTFSSTIPFLVATVVLTLISWWMIIRIRAAIHRWKRSVVIDCALQTITLYETCTPLVSVSHVELSYTERFPEMGLLLKTSSADYALLNGKYDW